MSMAFDRPIGDDVADEIRQVFREIAGMDDRTVLFNDRCISGSDLKRITRKANQTVTISFPGAGETRVLRDGTEYVMTSSGWRRIDAGEL